MEITIIDFFNMIIAIFAFCISAISLYKSHMSGRPYINLVNMFFDPSEFHCFSLENCNGHEKLTNLHKDIIKKTLGRICYTSINGKKYLIINTLDANFEFKNVRLILAPYQFTYVNTGGFATEIHLVKGIFKLKNRETYEKDINCIITPEGIDNEINIRIAYVCQEGFDTSIIYNRLFGINEKFSYKNDIERARNIINFEKEEYIVKCKNNAKSKYTIKVIFEWDNNELKFNIK